MKLTEGTRAEHIATLQKAYKNNITYIWSGDLRNAYLRENLVFGIHEGIINVSEYNNYEAQESGYIIEWLKEPKES